jgi:uncharacterized protein YndB with AHSA1/START domain
MMTTEVTGNESSVKKSVTVKCSREHAFEIFIKRFDLWWPKTHKIGKADFKTAVIEEKTGGRWYEVGVDGSTCEWGHVLAYEPPSRVTLTWHLQPNWQHDPDMNRASRVDVTFTDLGNAQTRVELVHSELEKHGNGWQEMAKELAGGWGGIIDSFAQVADKAAAS